MLINVLSVNYVQCGGPIEGIQTQNITFFFFHLILSRASALKFVHITFDKGYTPNVLHEIEPQTWRDVKKI